MLFIPSIGFLGHSPYEKLFHGTSNYKFLWVFGCASFPDLSTQVSHKIAPHFISCVFLGYASEYKDNQCMDPKSGRLYVSQHVAFHEFIFSYHELSSSPIVSPLSITSNPLVFTSH